MKKSTYLSLICLLLIATLTISFLSCQPAEQPPVETDGKTEGTDAVTEPETDAPVPTFVVFENGEFNFRIVREENMADITPASHLFSKLKELSGIGFIDFTTDARYTGHDYEPERYEILCAYTNYPESISVAETIGPYEYKIAVEGNKIVIVSKNPDAYMPAVEAFLLYVEENIKDGRLEIPADICITGSIPEPEVVPLDPMFNILAEGLPAIKNYNGVSFSDCGDGFVQATYKATDLESFEKFCTDIEAEGYSLYTRRDVAGDPYVTYLKGTAGLHIYFTDHNAELRIIAFDDKPLPSLDEVSYEKICEPSMTLMGLGKSGSTGGLGFVLRLEDGSFVIVDGGHHNQTEGNDLHDTLLSLSVDGKIRIKCWIITHAHSDHYGSFVVFSENYRDKDYISIESFVVNFCNTAEQNKYSPALYYKRTVEEIENSWPEATCYKGLTGQVYKLPGCDMEVLYCMSDFIPQILGEEEGIKGIEKNDVDGNLTNMAIRFEIAGQKIFVTGDASKVNCDEMTARYGEYLKSDIMTVPHHGHNRNQYRARNGTIQFYARVRPSIVLWPDVEDKVASRLEYSGLPGTNYEANYYLMHEIGIVESIIAGSTNKTRTLPYWGK